MISRRFFMTLLGAFAVAGGRSRAFAQAAAASSGTAGEWPTYGGDLASTRYSSLNQINSANFSTLQVAWRFRTDSFGPRPEINIEGTPLMAGGMLYATVGSRRDVVALDAATGEMLWSHREDEGA